MDRDHYVIEVYCLVCEQYAALTAHNRIRHGDFAPALTDEEVITIEICGEFVGCWTRSLARVLSTRVQCSHTGVDIEPAARAVDAARKAMPSHRFLVVPSVEALPFEAESFDVAVLTEVIEHVSPRREAQLLTELARILRPGGSIILSTPYHNLLDPLDPAWFFGHRRYSVQRIAEFAQSSGLSVTDVEFSGGIWSALDTNLPYIYNHVRHRPYRSYPWLHASVQCEYQATSRRVLATTLWCRLVH